VTHYPHYRYYITDWDQRYEVDAKGRLWNGTSPKRAGRLEYVRLRVHGNSMGLGWRRLLAVAGQRTAPAVFGIFCKILEVAADAPREKRGYVDDTPESPLSFVLGLDDRDVKKALAVLSSPKLGWLSKESSDNSNKHNTTQLNSSNSTFSGNFRESPGNPPLVAEKLAIFLEELIRKRQPKFVRRGNWAKDIDRMIRLDKRDPKDIEAVIRWCQADTFWCNNILSASKLRLQYDQLDLKRKAQTNATTTNHSGRPAPQYRRDLEFTDKAYAGVQIGDDD